MGDTVSFTATGGVRYEFFRNGASLGPASTTATLSRSDLVTGDQITVEVTNTNSCTTLSSAITMSVSNPPAAAISSGLTADTMCEIYLSLQHHQQLQDIPINSLLMGHYKPQVLRPIPLILPYRGHINRWRSYFSQVTNTDGCTSSASLTLRVNSLSGRTPLQEVRRFVQAVIQQL